MKSSAYVGVPPMEIKREAKEADPELLSRTYQPALKWVMRRCLLEAMGLTALFFCAAVLVTFSIVTSTAIFYRYQPFLPLLPLISFADAIMAVLITRIAKTVVLWKYQTGEFPLYSMQVVRSTISEFFEMAFAGDMAFPLISGTIWAPWYYRLMGAKVGKRCYFHGAYMTEHDLMTVGDYVTMEPNSLLQGHLFQDRIRSTGPITIGSHCGISSDSIVLMRASLGDKALVGTFSLVPRYEQLPANTIWHGITVVPASKSTRPIITPVTAATATGAAPQCCTSNDHISIVISQ